MRRLLAVLVVVGILAGCRSGSEAGTIRVTGFAPSQLNDGACGAPVLLPASGQLVVHVQVVGRGLEDSLTTVPGGPFSFTWAIPAGTYTVRAWASIFGAPAMVGCDTTVTKTIAAPPHTVRVN
jgi:hypothetical protein